MEVKRKILLLLNRIKNCYKNDIKQNFSEEYCKGFNHAINILDITIEKEFGSYIQIEENKINQIRLLNKDIDRLKNKISDLNYKIDTFEKKHVVHNFRVSKGSYRRICQAISAITLKPYKNVLEQFSKPILIEEKK